MKYLLLVCSDGVPTQEKAAANRSGLPTWLDELERRGNRVYGERLAPATAARTVRVRDERTIVSDGPFAETKEFIAGFDIIDCADLDEAIAIAAGHPVARFHAIEVRPFAQPAKGIPEWCAPDAHADPRELAGKLERPVADGDHRYLLMACVDGIPGTDEEESAIQRDGETWLSELRRGGNSVYGHALAAAQMATTVRVRDGDTIISDGPFAETKEFVAGFDVLDCADLDEAVRIAARHPLARVHRCEVRPFWEDR